MSAISHRVEKRIAPRGRSQDRPGRGGFLLRGAVVLGLLGLSLLGIYTLTAAVLAHERRTVGNYTIVIGLRDEPPLAGYPNALDMRVTRADTGEPVTGLEGTLRVELLTPDGRQRREIVLLPVPGKPGSYTSDPFILAKPGRYVFRVVGRIGGQPVDERFASDKVEDPAHLRFPPGEGGRPVLALALSAAALALGAVGAGSGLYALLRRGQRGG
jgi:hypothetical protein